MKNLNKVNKNEKNVQSTKKVVNEKNVQNVIETSKNLLSDDNILNLDLNNLDDSNFENLLSKLNEQTPIKQKSKKRNLYKNELDKKQRTKIRKQRNNLINNIIYFASNKQNKELKNEIEQFNTFYKATYLLNDYSLNSITFLNADKDTKIKLKIALKIVKDNLVK